MIDIETASRSIDIVIGMAVLIMIASAFLAWFWVRLTARENAVKTKAKVDRAVQTAREQCRREMISKGAASFSKEMEMKRTIRAQETQIRRLTAENKRMQSIIERASL